MTTINILISDSEEENVLALKSSLKREDIRIFSATSPNQALLLAGENNFALAFIDIDNKDAGSFKLAELLRSKAQHGADAAIVFLISQSSAITDNFNAPGHGIIDYMYKPLNPHITAAKIDSFIQLAHFHAEVKQKNKQLSKSKATAEYSKKVKETFLANMSHELRTPVNGIIGLTGLLRKTPLNEQQNSMIDLLEVSSQSLLGVINDVLDISKMDAGKFTIIRSPNNLHDLLRAAYGLLRFKADENNIEFLLEIAPDVPVNLMIDSLRLNQVLMNLLSNAIKFTHRGYVKLSVVVLQKNEDKVKLKFSVEDSGIGIPENRLSSVFDSFEQAEEDTAAKYGGTGLGLTIVKKLIDLKGGELIVDSKPGKGSTFSFINWYTVAAKPKAGPAFKTETALEQFENVNILVAEDNLVNQFMLSKMLKDWNIDVEMVDNGQKVMEKLQLNNYDLILMDTHMPEMNGYETAKAIRNDFAEPKKSIPIISLSAASFDYEQEEALISGMNDVLSKPFQPQELHRKIKRLLKTGDMVKIPV